MNKNCELPACRNRFTATTSSMVAILGLWAGTDIANEKGLTGVGRRLLFLALLAICCATTQLRAAPISYQVDGTLSIGSVPANAAELFQPTLLDAAALGLASGTLVYDGAGAVFVESIMGTTDGINFFPIGASYSIPGSLQLTLADGTTASSNNITMDVITEATFGGPDFTLHVALPVPDGLWVGETAPPDCPPVGNPPAGSTCWAAFASGLELLLAGDPGGNLPPADLGGALLPGIGAGQLCTDPDGDGSINVLNDCGELLFTATALSPVPVPTAVWLFASALGLLAGVRRPIRQITNGGCSACTA